MTLRAELRDTLERARARTLRLTRDLDDRALRTQHHPGLSPIGWHLGHVAWTEASWVHTRLCGLAPRGGDDLYSSFVSVKSERGARLPAAGALRAEVAAVRERTLELLEHADLERPGAAWILRFVADHERQHAETMACARLAGALALPDAPPVETGPVPAAGFARVPGGRYRTGDDADPHGWDNERDAHDVELAAFELSLSPVTCADWLAFMEQGGYRDDRLWTDDGRAWRDAAGVRAPEHWIARDGAWRRVTLGGERDVVPSHPVSHVSLHEAWAFARFAGARLPTEAEWEAAASYGPAGKRRYPWGDAPGPGNLDLAACDTTPCGARPDARSALGLHDLAGNVWEWTASSFAPYPNFRSGPYEGYSAPWFDGNHHVLRGGAWCTQPEIARCSFRNWFHAGFRSVPSGLRLAR